MSKEIDKEFMEKLINNIINSKPKLISRGCDLVMPMPKIHVEKINKYLSTIKLSFFRLFVALLREYAEDEETRRECLKHMPIEYSSDFNSKKEVHLSRDAYDLLAMEAHRIKMERKALGATLLMLFIDRKVIFKSEKLLETIIFERLL